MRKYFILNDLCFVAFALMMCRASLDLGFGSFSSPHAGFMPFLSSCLLGLLALADLISGLRGEWARIYGEKDLWAGANGKRFAITLISLFLYAFFFQTFGFLILTVLLLLLFFQMLEPRPWWKLSLLSIFTTFVFYTIFKVGLEVQLPMGLFGF